MLTLDRYWHDVAERYTLTLDESEQLARYLSQHPHAGENGETSASIIHDALAPNVRALLALSEGIDANLSQRVGVDIGHSATGAGVAIITCYASTANAMLTAFSDGERYAYRINRESYATPAEIPATQRKHKGIAQAFSESAELILASLSAYVEYQNAYQRMNAFYRMG